MSKNIHARVHCAHVVYIEQSWSSRGRKCCSAINLIEHVVSQPGRLARCVLHAHRKECTLLVRFNLQSAAYAMGMALTYAQVSTSSAIPVIPQRLHLTLLPVAVGNGYFTATQLPFQDSARRGRSERATDAPRLHETHLLLLALTDCSCRLKADGDKGAELQIVRNEQGLVVCPFKQQAIELKSRCWWVEDLRTGSAEDTLKLSSRSYQVNE
jgi:hypothetical protein